jgi:hypothetical protein
VKPPSAIQPESAPSMHRPSDPPMKMKTPGAPFLARPLREKWGFSTEQVKRAEGAKPGRASLMRPALAHRFGSAVVAAPDSATLPGVKNRRKTCPKIISSANNATASEKIIPPTTAMNVIAICMMSPCSSFFGRSRLPASTCPALIPVARRGPDRIRLKISRLGLDDWGRRVCQLPRRVYRYTGSAAPQG